MDRAWGIITRDGRLHTPVGGVELLTWDGATPSTYRTFAKAVWEDSDKHQQPDGHQHRWRHVVPASAIERIVYDLGPIIPAGCTGSVNEFGLLAHDGETCPVHEADG